jgi:hypothetical protein
LPYRLLADAVLVAHAAFVAFVTLGGLLTLRWDRAKWIHLPALAWAVYIELTGGICPLTPLENHFRALAGEQGYPGGFIEHYVVALLYPDGLTPTIQYALALLVVVVNVAVYLWVRHGRRDRSKPA